MQNLLLRRRNLAVDPSCTQHMTLCQILWRKAPDNGRHFPLRNLSKTLAASRYVGHCQRHGTTVADSLSRYPLVTQGPLTDLGVRNLRPGPTRREIPDP